MAVGDCEGASGVVCRALAAHAALAQHDDVLAGHSAFALERDLSGGRQIPKPARRADDPGARAAALVEAFQEDYPSYQYRFVEFFAEHMADLSRAFGGDLQEAMVLAILGQVRLRAIRETLARGEAPAPLMQGDGTTASRIADVTGIPRQTVRRKLLALKDKGWIAQDEGGLWRIVADADGLGTPVRRDLADFNRRAMGRIARLVTDLEGFADR